MDKRKFRKSKNKVSAYPDLQEYVEESIYNVYWRWSMITFILFNDPVRAQEVMSATTKKMHGYEKTARKVVFKIFTEIILNPAAQIEKFIRYALRQEIIRDEGSGYAQTRQLLLHLLERGLISNAQHRNWLKKIDRLDCGREISLTEI